MNAKFLSRTGQYGFTLIELIITVSIISIMILVVGQVYLIGMVQGKSNMKKAQLQTEGKSAMDGIMKNVKVASAIESAYGEYTSDGTHLILRMPAIDTNENFIYIAPTNDYVTYYLEGKNLHKLVTSANTSSRLFAQNGSDNIILSNVKTLAFTYSAVTPATSSLVTLEMTLENTTQKVPIEIKLKSSGRLRNVQ